MTFLKAARRGSALRSTSSALLAAAVLGVGFSAGSARAQSFNVLYDFTGEPGNQASTAASSASVPANLTAAPLTRGPEIGANAGAGSINSNSWNTSTLDLGAYYSFGVTPAAGFTANLTSLSYIERRSGTGPTSFVIRSSADGFASNLFSYSLLASNTNDTPESFSLGGISSLQNLNTAITLRIYGFGASAAGGTYRLTSPTAGTGLVLGGTLNAGHPTPDRWRRGSGAGFAGLPAASPARPRADGGSATPQIVPRSDERLPRRVG
jgi:hypothetical protein